ncbi:MAG: excinuclease ABC subunit UvrC [Candidatus Binatia bacterium]
MPEDGGPERSPRAGAEEGSARAAARDRLASKVRALPRRPGVYMFKDASKKVIYVGKAKSLQTRLRSYLQDGGDGRYQVRFLMEKAVDLETLVTENEAEALILEANLIHQYKPRYNIRLKDDKTYLSVKITTREEWPRITVTRRVSKDGNTYLGPFVSAAGLRETISTIRKVFPLRTCSNTIFRNRSRPCLEYQIKRCLAPCVLPVDGGEYRQHLDAATRLLEGKTEELVAELEDQMRAASEAQRYEEAARFRDRAAAIAKMASRQKVVVHGGGDRDVFGMYREGGFIEAQVLLVRAGKLTGHLAYHFDDHEFPDEEVLSAFTARFYEGPRYIPDEVLLPVEIDTMEGLASYLTDKRGSRVRVSAPSRGEKKRLVEMAVENAAHSLAERDDEALRREKMSAELKARLGLASVPKRIECFDISHVQGEAVVASMVAFDEGQPDRSGYRRYRLKGVQRNDDFAAMKEVLGRRLKRGMREGGLPDLLLVDGGRGQLAMAVAVVRELGVEGMELAAIAKDRVAGDMRAASVERSDERVFRPGRSNPVKLRRNSNALFLLQRLRDEAHRFAIGFHRELRSKKRLRSALDDVRGVGPTRRRALLSRFGSVKRLAEASIEEIARVPGIGRELAIGISDHLKG